MFWDSLFRDLHYAARQLRRSPAFTVTALVTLILAIGANVIVFSVLNALVLRPLDVPQSAALYNVVHKQPAYDNQSYPDYIDFKNRNKTFRDMAVYRFQPAGLTAGTAAYQCWYYRVSGNYFDMLGVQPALGRLFHATDEHGPQSAPYIVLSHDFWRGRFASDPAIVGATVHINKHPFTVIGVAPASFHGTDIFLWPDFWMPYRQHARRRRHQLPLQPLHAQSLDTRPTRARRNHETGHRQSQRHRTRNGPRKSRR